MPRTDDCRIPPEWREQALRLVNTGECDPAFLRWLDSGTDAADAGLRAVKKMLTEDDLGRLLDEAFNSNLGDRP